jgi:FixJ family two-component response regulator
VDGGRTCSENGILISRAGWQPELCASAEEFLNLPRVQSPSCLVLEVALPDINGLDLQRLVADRLEMPIIFITGYGEVPVTVRAMKAGAVEFLTKPFGSDVLLSAIRDALERSHAAIRQVAEIKGLRDSYASLTRRERDVMALVVAGRLNKEVGGELGISEITVKAHRGNMVRKMNAKSLPDLVKMAASLGLTSHRRRVKASRFKSVALNVRLTRNSARGAERTRRRA